MRSAFRSLEISDPRFETERLRLITVKSRAFSGRGDITLHVPEAEAPLPVAILLHGVHGSHWAWALKGGVHRTAARLVAEGAIPPMALAMPSDGLWGDGTGYIDRSEGDFERWIVEDVPRAVAEALGYPPARLFLCGLSMGGYGALRIGAKHGARFAGISAHSAITRLEELEDFVEESPRLAGGRMQDRCALRTILAHRATLPALRFDCGVEDPLIAGNRMLHRQLEAAGVAHDYAEFEGGHDWSYWEAHVADSLRFFGGISRERESCII